MGKYSERRVHYVVWIYKISKEDDNDWFFLKPNENCNKWKEKCYFPNMDLYNNLKYLQYT